MIQHSVIAPPPMRFNSIDPKEGTETVSRIVLNVTGQLASIASTRKRVLKQEGRAVAIMRHISLQ